MLNLIRVFKYDIDDENWNPSYTLPEHVEDLKTIRKFRNVFDAEVQKPEAYMHATTMALSHSSLEGKTEGKFLW